MILLRISTRKKGSQENLIASLLTQASQKARIIAASEGFAFASATSWCQSQLQAEASHCKQWQEQPKNTSDAEHQDRRSVCGQFRCAGENGRKP